MRLDRLADRVILLRPSISLATAADPPQAGGPRPLLFVEGEPADFDTPEFVKEAARQALREGWTKYGPTGGLPELKDCIRQKLSDENGLVYGPDEVVVTVGAKQAIFNALMALCNPGEEVLIPAPYWTSYPEQVRLVGGTTRILRTDGPSWRLTPGRLAEALSPKSRVLILNNPANPTGVVYTREELTALATVVERADLWVIADEIYEKYVYDGRAFTAFASLGPEIQQRTVTVNGVSKAFAMTGWRLGYAAGPASLIRAMTLVQGHSTSCANVMTQRATMAALRGGQEAVQTMVAAFQQRRDLMVNGLNRIGGIHCPRPEGALYVFPDVSRLLEGGSVGAPLRTSVELARYLLEEAGVAVVPGEAFGAERAMRMVIAAPPEQIAEALVRMESCLQRRIAR